MLRTGCQWKAVPKEHGSGSTIHRTFQEWQRAGFFELMWMISLWEYDELEGIGWEWQSVDGCMIKAPLTLESVGKTLRIGEKMGTKRSILTDEKEIPLSVVLSGADTHDSKLLEDTLDNIVILRPAPEEEKPQNLCLDAGYTGCNELAEEKGYKAHIRSQRRGEKRTGNQFGFPCP